MTNVDPSKYAHYRMHGLWEEARAAVTMKIEAEGVSAPLLTGRGVCNLGRRDLDSAAADFKWATALRPETDHYSILLGIAYWWKGEQDKAVGAWDAALSARYVDEAGGVTAPSIRLFAATRQSDVNAEIRSLAILRSLWTPRLARLWPGPIAGFLIGEMDPETFLLRQNFLNPVLEERRLCRANFWMATAALRQGDLAEYQRLLRQSVTTPEAGAAYMEGEYWLASAELDLAIAKARSD